MKDQLYKLIIALAGLPGIFIPVAAIMPGTASGNESAVVSAGGGQPVVVYETPLIYQTPATVPGLTPPAIDSFTILVLGAIILIIAATGLLWRYFHPKYIPPEERK